LGEQCEQASHNSTLPYGCVGCLFNSLFCGDGKVDPGEECDNGPLNSTSPDAHCRPNCHIARCGDGILDSSELCDDGNYLNRDGCDRYCLIEEADKPSATVIASDTENIDFNATPTAPIASQYQPGYQQFGFPQYPNYQQLPYQLPLAQLQPLVQRQGPIGDTGPAAVAVIGAGAAAGLSWIRRKRK